MTYKNIKIVNFPKCRQFSNHTQGRMSRRFLEFLSFQLYKNIEIYLSNFYSQARAWKSVSFPRGCSYDAKGMKSFIFNRFDVMKTPWMGTLTGVTSPFYELILFDIISRTYVLLFLSPSSFLHTPYCPEGSYECVELSEEEVGLAVLPEGKRSPRFLT